MGEEEIEKLRGVVRDCVSKHLCSSSIFFADEVAAFTSDPADIYMQAQALFLGRLYRRAFHLLNSSQIVLRDLRFAILLLSAWFVIPVYLLEKKNAFFFDCLIKDNMSSNC
ncbi:Cell division cycle protein 16 [Ancistrocladus abbreviatus]